MTSRVYSHVSLVLSADHRDLLALLVALQRLHATRQLTDCEMSLWMSDVTDLGKVASQLQAVDDTRPHWLSAEVVFLIILYIILAVFPTALGCRSPSNQAPPTLPYLVDNCDVMPPKMAI